jgi:predicted ATPase
MKESNQWYVITGAPCSGKTSVIRELVKRGYCTVSETARAYIEKQLATGLTMEQIKEDELAFERHVLYLKVSDEASLPSNKIIFFDRAIPDSIAYFKLHGLDPTEPLSLSRRTTYKKVFLFERLPFEKDPVRIEDDMIAEKLEVLIDDCYRELGYSVIRVPVAPIERRTNLILEKVSTP